MNLSDQTWLKREERKKPRVERNVQEDMDKFIANGGTIEKIPNGVSGEKRAIYNNMPVTNKPSRGGRATARTKNAK